MVTVTDFVEYANVANDAAAASAFNVAVSMVNETLLSAYRSVPDDVWDRLVLEVAFAFYKRSSDPSGGSQGIEYGTGAAVLGPKDPLSTVWPILRRYVMPL